MTVPDQLGVLDSSAVPRTMTAQAPAPRPCSMRGSSSMRIETRASRRRFVEMHAAGAEREAEALAVPREPDRRQMDDAVLAVGCRGAPGLGWRAARRPPPSEGRCRAWLWTSSSSLPPGGARHGPETLEQTPLLVRGRALSRRRVPPGRARTYRPGDGGRAPWRGRRGSRRGAGRT